jgi:hypothetical protein
MRLDDLPTLAEKLEATRLLETVAVLPLRPGEVARVRNNACAPLYVAEGCTPVHASLLLVADVIEVLFRDLKVAIIVCESKQQAKCVFAECRRLHGTLIGAATRYGNGGHLLDETG